MISTADVQVDMAVKVIRADGTVQQVAGQPSAILQLSCLCGAMWLEPEMQVDLRPTIWCPACGRKED